MFEIKCYDFFLKRAILHHLCEEDDWEFIFTKLYQSLKLGGCLMISNLIEHDCDILNSYMRKLYSAYLEV